jgi:hypothetical protein
MYKHKNTTILKKLERTDLPMLKELKDESWFGTHTTAIVNMDDQIKWFESLSNSSLILVVNGNVGLIKITQIDWMNRRCYFAYDVFSKYRGKGYGKKIVEAGVDFIFEILNMNRIECEVLANNLASLKCIRSVGFKEDGIKEKCIFKCGRWIDNVLFGLPQMDWSLSDRVIEMDKICNLSYIPKDGK